ncbi:aldehyde dehydrogenase family 3 member F1-like [Papaver somniferum]|uniref:aldehyde dehydrogenase family 3 member F1-like n=1 Tax=Papaver somniferum TaxID=3469 RepID=UPI000E7011C5|nr:aldehyde dehydrogenase family 3 member F1-like [Papaver somniferum]
MEGMESFVGENLDREAEKLRETFRSGKTKCVNWRRSQLKAILTLLREKEEEIFMALYKDLGKHRCEAYRDEIGVLEKTLKVALASLDEWVTTKKAKLPLAAFPTIGEIKPEPLGLVLIFSSWNFPFGLALQPLIGAIAAGNTVILKPSELAPACSSVLADIIPMYLDYEAVKVVKGGAMIAQRLLEMKWDKIFFTGSPRVGSIVMSAAAKHLTPVTLELGGKCPAVIDSLASSWDRKIATKRIIAGKYGACGGQACIGIDYILVLEEFAPVLIELLKIWIKRIYAENPRESMTRILNKSCFLRLKKILSDPAVGNSIIHGGSLDEDNLYIEPTILLNPPLEAEIMTDEIFGPILPIITLTKIEDSIEFINSRPKPLALYVFTNNETLKTRMINETSSGSLTFNDAVIQYTFETIPFGGVGQSGFGRYHGKFSFDTFSHEKGILKRSFLTEFWFRFPPWTANKLQLLRLAYDLDYFGIVLNVLGLKRS